MRNRYFVRRESRGNWAVVDSQRVGSGPVQAATVLLCSSKSIAEQHALSLEAA